MGTVQLNDWENPQVVGRNKEPAHATAITFADVPSALRGERSDSPYFMLLNGDWRFHWSPNPGTAPEDFYREDFDDSSWDTIAVPGNWQVQGYGVPRYLSADYAFDITHLPRVQEDTNEVGSYRTTFTIPEEWRGRQVFIHFDGVDSAFYLWINGQMVGYSQDSRLPAEFNITPYIRPGENLLAVRVYRWSDGSYLEDQDMWFLSGIFRDVYLFSTPTVHIRDFLGCGQNWDADYRDAVLPAAGQRQELWRAGCGGLYFRDGTLWRDRRVGESAIGVAVGAGSEVVLELEQAVAIPGNGRRRSRTCTRCCSRSRTGVAGCSKCSGVTSASGRSKSGVAKFSSTACRSTSEG
jgi:Beta-galactosidase/beta-glucuronidase